MSAPEQEQDDGVPDVPPDGATVEVGDVTWTARLDEDGGWWETTHTAWSPEGCCATYLVFAPDADALTALWRERALRRHDAGPRAARELTQQAQELGMYEEQVAPASALDRVMAALFLAATILRQPPADDTVAAQKELAQLRAENTHLRGQLRLCEIDCANTEAENAQLRAALADVARLEAWLRERPFYRDVSWSQGVFRAYTGGRITTADSLPALGAAVATEGKDTP